MQAFPKVIVIGLDGGTFDLIDPWVDSGYLPNLARLFQNGCRARLESVILPFTPQAWSSFMTGMNPGNHGVFGFKEKTEGQYAFQFVNNRSIKAKTLWRHLSECGKRSILVNIPMTYPPEAIEGIVVGGMDSPGIDSDFTFPPGIKDEIFQVEKDYVIHLHVGAGYLDSDQKRRKAFEELLRMASCRERLVHHFMAKHPWDFFAVNFSAIDQVQHHFWAYLKEGNAFKNVILEVYQRVDKAIGRICERLPAGTTVYLMSDHGAGPASPYVFFIDEWLREQGLLAFKNTVSAKGIGTHLVKWALTACSKKLSSTMKDKMMRWFPAMRVKSQGYIRRALIDWEKTRVYSGEHPATLRLNLKGRDPLGVVGPGEYESLRAELVDRLENLTHPDTGEHLIRKVYLREELYSGRYLDRAPDLILEPLNFAHQVKGGRFSSGFYKQVISEKDPKEFFVNGVHRLNGIFAAMGPGIKKGSSHSPLKLYDLFPTILYSLGLEIPEGVDGRVAEGIFVPEHVKRFPVRFSGQGIQDETVVDTGIENYGERDAERIAESLRGLGYID